MKKLKETFACWRRITAWAEGKYPRWTEFECFFFDLITTTAKRIGAEQSPDRESLALVKRLTTFLSHVVTKLIAGERDKEFYERVIPGWKGRSPTEAEIKAAFPGRVPRKEIAEIRFNGFPRLMTIAAQMDAKALYRPPAPFALRGVWVEGPLEEDDSEVA